MNLRINIRQKRKEKKLSIARLSKNSNVARGYISEIENGKCNNPGIKTLWKIKKVLGCSLDELIEEDNYGE